MFAFAPETRTSHVQVRVWHYGVKVFLRSRVLTEEVSGADKPPVIEIAGSANACHETGLPVQYEGNVAGRLFESSAFQRVPVRPGHIRFKVPLWCGHVGDAKPGGLGEI